MPSQSKQMLITIKLGKDHIFLPLNNFVVLCEYQCEKRDVEETILF